MNRTLGHFCAHVGLIGLGEPPEDGDMSEMTLPSRHRIRNSNPGDMRPSMLRTSKEVIYITALVADLSVTEAPTILSFTNEFGRNIFIGLRVTTG